MLSFRQLTTLIWSLSAFVLAGALALHLRYRPLAEQPAYLDTWTGEVRGSMSQGPVSLRTIESRITSDAERAEAMAERLRVRIERMQHREARMVVPCPATVVRFAFPADGSR